MLHEFLRTCPVYKYMLKQVYFVHRKRKPLLVYSNRLEEKGKLWRRLIPRWHLLHCLCS
uniref:Uncharacterized protein n=1 Tax=Populus trichocarpa TaxID=3694 RepID=A0A3N7ETT2_POPTR